MSGTLNFLPYLRSGLASLYEPEADTSTLSIGLSLSGTRVDGATPDSHEFATRNVRLLGPGAVVGVSPDEVLRRDPKPSATGVEPNYFAALELRSADLPWRFTPGAPDADGHLKPWLALVVVEQRTGVTLTQSAEGRLQSLSVDETNLELPSLRDVWSWAHVQYDGTLATDATANADLLTAALEARSPDLRARLICPRRLEAGRSYFACLVPTFKAGKLAGAGSPGSQDLTPAWGDDDAPVTLPVYLSWRFTTGPRGDFEALVNRLSPHESSASVGLRKLDLSDAGVWRTGKEVEAFYGGALVSPSALDLLNEMAQNPQQAEHEFGESLAEMVNAPLATVDERQAAERDPVVAPPAYGRTYRGVDKVAGGESAKGWFDRVNTLAPNRAVAGLGAELVRKNQEKLMDMAWDAARDVTQANMHLNVAQVSRQVGAVAQNRFSRMSDATLMRVTAPAHNAIAGGNAALTTNAQLHNSAIPNGLFSSATRRITRPLTGLTSEGGTADPGEVVTAAFLSNPLGFFGAYRDALSPMGLTAEATPAPAYEEAATAGALGEVVLGVPDPTKRTRQKFSQPAGISNLVASVRSAQDPDTLLGAAMRARIPALKKAATPLPRKIDLAPRFTQPVYQLLRENSVEHLVPGIGEIPAETVTILNPNPIFTRAFLLGMNHEMAREFMWREYPTPLNGTWFRHFWNPAVPAITPVASWMDDETLSGSDPGELPQDEMVLVVRGTLPQRYPHLRLYAVQAEWKPIPDAANPEHWYRDERQDGRIVSPHMAGQLSEDVFFFGFQLGRHAAVGTTNPNASAGYFFAFEEIPGAPRFGLESAVEGAAMGQAPASWQTISWADVTPADGQTWTRFVDLEATEWMRDGTPRPGNGPTPVVWAQDAAAFARQTLQRPARVLLHASAMLPD